MGGILYIVLIVGVFYFFMIAPEKKKQSKAKDMMNNLQEGDVVMTRGGIQGTIVALGETLVTIATGPDEVKIDVSRPGIATIIEKAPEEEYEDDDGEYEDDEYEDEEDAEEDKSSVSLDKK